MGIYEEYKAKLKTPEEAVKLVRDGDWVDYGQTCMFPEALDEALAKRKGELKDVNVRCAISIKPVHVAEDDPERESFTYNLWHCSGRDRKYIEKGMAFHQPMLFRDCGSYYTRGYAKVGVAMISVPPMDKNGFFNFSLSNCATHEMLSAADRIVLEVNENLPIVFGTQADHIHISQIDAVVEGGRDVCLAPASAATDIDEKISQHIFPYLQDGVTLQLGIGGMPNAVGTLIAQSDLKNLGMHTELMSDGYLELYRSGKMNDTAKELNTGKGVFSICFGGRELYEFLDHNLAVISAPMHYVNDPSTIRQLKKFASINSCISVDLFGQVCSETSGLRQISGTGGQLDFVTGAYMAEEGKAFLALPSTFTDKKGVVHTNIIPRFSEGDVITTPRTQAPYMVTEYGVACLSGLTTWQRAEALIGIAHPDFRDQLIKEAEFQKIWRKSNKK